MQFGSHSWPCLRPAQRDRASALPCASCGGRPQGDSVVVVPVVAEVISLRVSVAVTVGVVVEVAAVVVVLGVMLLLV